MVEEEDSSPNDTYKSISRRIYNHCWCGGQSAPKYDLCSWFYPGESGTNILEHL